MMRPVDDAAKRQAARRGAAALFDPAHDPPEHVAWWAALRQQRLRDPTCGLVAPANPEARVPLVGARKAPKPPPEPLVEWRDDAQPQPGASGLPPAGNYRCRRCGALGPVAARCACRRGFHTVPADCG